jgi:hypothetical protein
MLCKYFVALSHTVRVSMREHLRTEFVKDWSAQKIVRVKEFFNPE